MDIIESLDSLQFDENLAFEQQIGNIVADDDAVIADRHAVLLGHQRGPSQMAECQ